ncbi:hypothetical protein CPK96_00310 [Salmonella enterica]|nr:hypothetical protein [Salmonella enterica]
MYRAIWLLRCRVPPGEFKESVTSLTNKNDITHAHSWIHRNAGKLLFAGGVLQPFYFSRGLGKSHFLQINTDCPPPSDNAAFIVDPDSMEKSSTSPPA